MQLGQRFKLLNNVLLVRRLQGQLDELEECDDRFNRMLLLVL